MPRSRNHQCCAATATATAADPALHCTATITGWLIRTAMLVSIPPHLLVCVYILDFHHPCTNPGPNEGFVLSCPIDIGMAISLAWWWLYSPRRRRRRLLPPLIQIPMGTVESPYRSGLWCLAARARRMEIIGVTFVWVRLARLIPTFCFQYFRGGGKVSK